MAGMRRQGRQKKKAGMGSRVRSVVLWTLAGLFLSSVVAVLSMRWLNPPYSAVMLHRLAGEGAPQHQVWVDYDEISPFMALAVVAAEDQRFPQHWGFDTKQIIAAVEQHLDGGRLRGGSTISQQVARNLFLWQGRSFVRKGLEVWFTGLVELLWDKQRILEMYLNFAETGERVFGVGAASERYFRRSAGQLTENQAALVAAVLPNPVQLRIDQPSAYVRERQRWILGQMRNLGGPAYLDPLAEVSPTSRDR